MFVQIKSKDLAITFQVISSAAYDTFRKLHENDKGLRFESIPRAMSVLNKPVGDASRAGPNSLVTRKTISQDEHSIVLASGRDSEKERGSLLRSLTGGESDGDESNRIRPLPGQRPSSADKAGKSRAPGLHVHFSSSIIKAQTSARHKRPSIGSAAEEQAEELMREILNNNTEQ